MLSARKAAWGWVPSTRRLLCWPEGGTVTIHPALTAANAAAPARPLRSLRFCLEHRMFGNEPSGEIAPQRRDQLARQGDDGDAFDATAPIERALTEPLTERAVRLMSQPQPGQLDRFVACARITGLADPLLMVGRSAAPRTGRQAAIAGDLAPIAEVLIEDLVGQRRRKHRTQAFEPKQQGAAPRHLCRGGWRIRANSRLRERFKLLPHQHQPGMLALELGGEPRRYRLALPIALRREPDQPVAAAGVAHSHPQEPQQCLDPIGVSGLFCDQSLPLAGIAAGVLLLRARHAHDPHHPRLAAPMRHQRAHPSDAGAAKTRRIPPRSNSPLPAPIPVPAPPAPAHARSAPANRHDPRPEACGARSDPDQDCASSPANSAGSVQSLPKSCQNDRRWACIRWMLASDVSVGSSVGNPNLSDARSSPHGIYSSLDDP